MNTRKMDLQLFADAVSGKKIIYLYRVLEDAANDSATAVAFTTENSRTKSKDADSTATKDGSIRTPGVAESEITATSILSDEDTMIAKLEVAMDEDKKIEVWEVNMEAPGTGENAGKYKAKYFQGYLTEIEVSSTAEDFAEVSLTFGLEGNGADGYATVTDEQEAIATYAFADTEKTGA